MSIQVRQMQAKKDITDSSSEDDADDLVEVKQDKPKVSNSPLPSGFDDLKMKKN